LGPELHYSDYCICMTNTFISRWLILLFRVPTLWILAWMYNREKVITWLLSTSIRCLILYMLKPDWLAHDYMKNRTRSSVLCSAAGHDLWGQSLGEVPINGQVLCLTLISCQIKMFRYL
jgi:hypothetical protein